MLLGSHLPDSPEPRLPAAGPLLVVLGVVIAVVGLLVWAGAFAWFGKLPGDLRYESGSTRIYLPFASMLVVSVLLSLLGFVGRKFF